MTEERPDFGAMAQEIMETVGEVLTTPGAERFKRRIAGSLRAAYAAGQAAQADRLVQAVEVVAAARSAMENLKDWYGGDMIRKEVSAALKDALAGLDTRQQNAPPAEASES